MEEESASAMEEESAPAIEESAPAMEEESAPAIEESAPAIYKEGDEVEIRCDDEGFENAWYAARVLSPSPEGGGRYSVSYESLTDDSDESRPLVETVSVSHMRPSPPRLRTSGGGRIGFGRLVDAFYNDGWWVGVVSKAPHKPAAGGGDYTVHFLHTDEDINFPPSDLRPHLEWVGGEWVRPQTPKDMLIKSCKFGEAKAVYHEHPSSKIARKPPFLSTVKKLSGGGGEGLSTVHVMYSEIKSSESCSKSKKGETIEDNTLMIDCLAKYAKNFGPLKAGHIVTKPAIEENKPNFRLKTFLQNKFSCCTSSLSEKKGGIFNFIAEAPPKTMLIHDKPLVPAKFNGESLLPQSILAEVEPSVGDRAIPKPGSKESEFQSVTLDCSQISHGTGNFIETAMQGQYKGVSYFMGDGRQSEVFAYQLQHGDALPCDDLNGHKTGQKRKRSIPRKVIVNTDTASEGNKDGVRIKRLDIREEVDKSVIVGHSSISHEIQTFCHGDGEKNHEDAPSTLNHEGDSVRDRQGSRLVSKQSLEGHSISLKEAVTQGEGGLKEIEIQSSSEIMLGSSSSMLLGTKTSQYETRDEARNESLFSTSEVLVSEDLTDPASGQSPAKKSHLPFHKRSSIWQIIESTEAISKLSRPPHFRPLEQCCEDLREGMAIGLMVTFPSLVNSVSEFKVHDSRDKFEEKLKVLMHFEEHGFDVQDVQARLKELLRIKDNHKQVVEKISELKVVIAGKENENDRMDAEIEATEKAFTALKHTLSHLREKKSIVLMKKEDVDSQMVKLQMDANVAEEMFQSAVHDFTGVADAPW